MQSVTIDVRQTDDAFATELQICYKQGEKKLKKGIQEVKTLLSSYPHEPKLLQLLTFFYIKKRKLRKANKCIEENYLHNPTHLPTRINYGDLCVRKGKLDQISVVFDNQVDLRKLYPSRKTFHVSEYRGFMTLMSFYHLAKKEKEAAEAYFYLAYCVDKAHPSVLLLRKKLTTVSWTKKWCAKMSAFLCSTKKFNRKERSDA